MLALSEHSHKTSTFESGCAATLINILCSNHKIVAMIWLVVCLCHPLPYCLLKCVSLSRQKSLLYSNEWHRYCTSQIRRSLEGKEPNRRIVRDRIEWEQYRTVHCSAALVISVPFHNSQWYYVCTNAMKILLKNRKKFPKFVYCFHIFV